MSRSKRKRFEKKSASARLGEARQQELIKDAPKKVEPKKPSPGNQVVLSKAEFAKHKKGRDTMLRAIGGISNQLDLDLIDEMVASNQLKYAAQKSIRSVGIKSAARAWKEVNHIVMRKGSVEMGEKKNKRVVKLFWEPMADFWRAQGIEAVKFSELVKQEKKPKVKMLCEVCMKDKAVKLIETPKGERQLCQYCRAKVTKGVEL